MRNLRGKLTVAVASAFGVMATIAGATCPGVVRSTITSSSWETIVFREPGTSAPQSVTFDVASLESGTLEVYTSGAWSAVSAPATVDGTRIRLSVSGSADVFYVFDECEDWIFTSDE